MLCLPWAWGTREGIEHVDVSLVGNIAKMKGLIFSTPKITLRGSVLFQQHRSLPIEMVFWLWYMNHTQKTFVFWIFFFISGLYILYLVTSLVINLPENLECFYLFTHLFLYLICIYQEPAYIVQANKMYCVKPNIFITEDIDTNMPRILKPKAKEFKISLGYQLAYIYSILLQKETAFICIL